MVWTAAPENGPLTIRGRSEAHALRAAKEKEE